MSKIGKKPITIPDGVEVSFSDGIFKAKGPVGELTLEVNPLVELKIEDKEIKVTIDDKNDRNKKAMWGTFRALVQNVMQGVKEGFERRLQIVGVGYKAQAQGKKLILNVGYSHPIEMEVPEGVEVNVEKDIISLKGTDKQVLGQFAAEIRATRKPEPYKGKGIRYEDEHVRRKAGKVVKAVGGGA